MANSSQDGGVIGKTGALEQLQAEWRHKSVPATAEGGGMALAYHKCADALSGPIAAQKRLLDAGEALVAKWLEIDADTIKQAQASGMTPEPTVYRECAEELKAMLRGGADAM